MRINLTTPMTDDKERQQRNKAVLDAIEQYTEERMDDAYGRIHTDGSRSGGQPIVIREGRTMKGGVCSQESLPSRPPPPAPNKGTKQMTNERLRQSIEQLTKDPAAEWQKGYGTCPIHAAKLYLQGTGPWRLEEIGINADDYLVRCFARYRDEVIKACAKALEADAKKCDCAALEERECSCGAWDDYKSITSARAVEIVRALVT